MATDFFTRKSTVIYCYPDTIDHPGATSHRHASLTTLCANGHAGTGTRHERERGTGAGHEYDGRTGAVYDADDASDDADDANVDAMDECLCRRQRNN